MLTHRYQRILVLGLLIVVSLYLLLPLVVSYALAQGLRGHGYQHVIVQLGYPGLTGMRIPVLSFQQDLGHESLMVSLTDAELQYRPAHLLNGRIDRVILPYVAVQILHTVSPRPEEDIVGQGSESEESPWSLLTAGDLMRRLPILPFDELRLDRVTIFREQATGPLRKMTVSGVLLQQEGELGGHLSFQGQDTAPYGLTVAGHSASTWSATLASHRPQAAPIISWQSHAHPEGPQIHVEAQLEVNVRELAPFIALLVPIGPDLGRVTGKVAMNWKGTAAAEASLLTIWGDPRTQWDGKFQAAITLPALQGMAKDIAVAFEGKFAGNATQVGWTLEPGVLVTATVNTQRRIIPEVVRRILPSGDQPVRIEHWKPVQGMLYWGESPVRMTAEGPVLLTYGLSPGPLVVEVEATRAEGAGRELVGVEGTFRVEGGLSKAVTEQLFAKEATGGLRGTLIVTGSHLQAVVLPSSAITIKQIESAVSVSRVTLQLAEALPVQCELATGHCSAGPTPITILLPSMRVMGHQAHLAQGTLLVQQAEAAGASWTLHGTLQATGLSLDVPQGGVLTTNWKVKVVANQTGMKADVRADTPAHEGLVTAKIDQPFSAAGGSLHGTASIAFDAGDGRLSKLVTGLPFPLDLTDGQLSATVDLSWSGAVDAKQRARLTTGTATIAADRLSGRYRDYRMQGLTTTLMLRAEGVGAITMVQPAAVKIAAVQTGVEVTNVAMMLQASWKETDSLPIADVKDLQCDVFGGAVTSPGVHVDWAQPSHQMTFSVRRLDLAKVLSTEQQKGLQGTGTLNGTLPVTFTPYSLMIGAGALEAEPPGGVIRYASMPESSKLITESDSHLHLVAQALNNFHYTVLRVGVEYADNGTLHLGIRLEGKNPDLKMSPPIHFNLTVQEHVPTLLKSLRLVQEIEDSVQKKLKPPGLS